MSEETLRGYVSEMEKDVAWRQSKGCGDKTSEVYRCPTCGGKMNSDESPLLWQAEPVESSLTCDSCNRTYPVRGGIVRFLEPEELQGQDALFAKLYNHWGRLYDLSTKVWAHLFHGGEARWRGDLVSYLEIARGARVLEVSIGTGGNLPYIGSFTCGLDIYGLDISQGMLTKCGRNLEKWGIKAELCLGNADSLPYADDSFDCVYHVGGINAFTNQEKALAEMVRVARPGTAVVISDESENMFYTGNIFTRLGLPKVDDFIKNRILKKYIWPDLTPQALKAPVKLLPEGVQDIEVHQAGDGTMYVLKFRKPSQDVDV